MDTVFPADIEFKAFRRDDRYCFGPGVSDMKGGLSGRVSIFRYR